MKKLSRIILSIVFLLAIVVLAANFIHVGNVDVLNPKGTIADKQRDLLVFTVLLISVVVVPVFVLLGFISWKYRAGNKKAIYTPDWDHNKWLEGIWWGIPCVIILILGVVTWASSHELDPFRLLESNKQPVNVQVIALEWKWLFIYPDYGIASVNELHMPKQTPINFTITSDAPMNSFWIPSLGGQIYAMSGMSTKLHLMADEEGKFKGSSANISGEGFAHMKFMAVSTSQSDFDAWVGKTENMNKLLDQKAYDKLSQPTVESIAYYSRVEHNLYGKIIMKYMMPESEASKDYDSMKVNGMSMGDKN